jgi:hypothetical protein
MLVCLQFDVTFPGLPCEWISLDVMDISGEMHLDVVNSLACLPRRKCEGCCKFNSNKTSFPMHVAPIAGFQDASSCRPGL